MKLGFIGTGNMARAMVSGIIDKNVCLPQEIACIGAGGTSARALCADTGISLLDTRADVLAFSDIAILAFKPQHLETISPAEADAATGKLIVSVLAGRDLASLSNAFPKAKNYARVMPNTPSQIGKGVSSFCFSTPPGDSERRSIQSLVSALGAAYEIEETQMHIATAINGCGPAVFFQFVNYLAKAAEQRGLDFETALKLASETGIGSLELLMQSGKTPQQLIDEVVSPNGVTHALLESLDRQDWRHSLDTGIEAAVNRSVELSNP